MPGPPSAGRLRIPDVDETRAPPKLILSDWLAAPAVDGPSEVHRGRRYLAHRTVAELYAAYAAECPDSVSYSWFVVLFL